MSKRRKPKAKEETPAVEAKPPRVVRYHKDEQTDSDARMTGVKMHDDDIEAGLSRLPAFQPDRRRPSSVPVRIVVENRPSPDAPRGTNGHSKSEPR